MKHLKTNINGGFPFELDDIRWQNGGFREALAGFIQSLTGGADCILSGCVVTGIAVAGNNLTYTISEGWAFINGQICFCPAVNNVTIPGGPGFYFGIVTTFDASGSKTFDDGGVHDTYQIDNAGIVASGNAIPAGRMAYNSPVNINGPVSALIVDQVLLFSRFIKFGFNNSGQTVEGNINDIASWNTIVLNFNGTQPLYIAPAGYPGQMVIATMKATTSTKQIKLVNNSPAPPAGYKVFITRNGSDCILNDGDVVVMCYDGTNWNVLSSHLGFGIGLALLNGWTRGPLGLQIFKAPDGRIFFQGSFSNNGYTTGGAQPIGTLPANWWPSAILTFVTHDATRGATGVIQIGTNGSISYIEGGIGGATSVNIDMNQVNFYPI